MSVPAATITRLEKTAVDNGFDCELPRQDDWLAFASTQAPLRIWLTAVDDDRLVLAVSQASVARALADQAAAFDATLPQGAQAALIATTAPELHRLVRRAFQLSRTLPDELLHAFEQQTAALPRTTEAERLVVERVGQNVFRGGLLEYWEGRCAVTGLAVGPLLRASHIKPWAACSTDAERLDIFNGLLLAPNLDAAFDCGLITVADVGDVLVSTELGREHARALGITQSLRVERLSDGHRSYLRFHREHVFRGHALERRMFQRYIGIDYSGEKTSSSRLPRLRVYTATRDGVATEQRPHADLSWHWTRQGLAAWLSERLREAIPTIVGIDHAFSFPSDYFERHVVGPSWTDFLADFHQHWPTDADGKWVRQLRGGARTGEPNWFRLTERRARSAKSVFRFGVNGEVATSTHAGLPWLRRVREETGGSVHFWPFDGWSIGSGRSAVVEVYPTIWREAFPLDGGTRDQHDAYAVAMALQAADRDGSIARLLEPSLTDTERARAQVEGWILGVC